ncbi:MAG: DUF924 domain-containing protein [Sphingomonas sp.]|uniref:DUF924 family protein n=1 Tax=Sphingomonas sp. TaxID=28214 RepID=UPI0017A84B1C|nr:DUF924 family protein [Sphingomonas sp.]MBA3666176.1 DUF924 domain-containing protein [Sphingomonas sp.]
MTVHLSPAEAAPAVLHFWFEELTEGQHWRKSPDLDRHIAERFGAVRKRVLAEEAAGWRETPATLLAAILLLDQFSRNMFRGTARAFEGDPLALELSKDALERGWVDAAPPPWRQFLMMPLMHSEWLDDQEKCVAEFQRFGEANLKFALLHRDQIAKFGRFPGRNAALGRRSTEAEEAALAEGAAF